VRYILKEYGTFISVLILLFIIGKFSPLIFFILFTFFQILLISNKRIVEQFASLFAVLLMSDGSLLFEATDQYKIVLLIISFIHFILLKGFSKISKDFFVFIPFMLIALISTFFSENISISLQKAISYCLIFLLLYNIICLDELKSKSKDFFSLIIVIFFIFLILGHLLVSAHITPSRVLGRYNGLMHNPNGLGILTCICFIVTYLFYKINYLVFTKKEIILILIIILIDSILSGSRNSFFAILIFIAFIQINKYHPLVSITLFAIFITLNSYYETIVANLATTLGLTDFLRVDTLKEASGRFVAWDFLYNKISFFDYFGHGFYGTDLLFYGKDQFKLSMLGHQGNAHNSYLTVWYDNGTFGLVAFVLMYIYLFTKLNQFTKIGYPAMFAISFTAFFESYLVGSLNPFTPLIILLLSTNNINLENKRNAEYYTSYK